MIRAELERRRWMTWLIVLGACALALYLGRAVANGTVGVRELTIFSLGLAGLGILIAPREKILRVGFWLWLLTFGLGWRTLYLTPSLNIHPIEVLGYLIVGLVIVQSILRRTPIDLRFPVLPLVLVGFALFGLVTGLIYGTASDIVVEEFKNFLVLIPVYYLVQWFIRDRKDWERVVYVMIGVITYVALLGLMDWVDPSLSQRIAGNPGVDPVYVTESYSGVAFGRVGFILYGSFLASFFIFTFFGFTTHHFLEALGRKHLQTLLYAGLMALQLAAMYLSGYRGLWYALIGFGVAYSLMRWRAVLLLGLGVLMYPFLPENFLRRFISVFVASEADSSQLDRFARAEGAAQLARQSPLIGVGLGGSGYVHSDLLQIAANLGIPALLVFLGWWATLLGSTFRLGRHSDWAGNYGAALFATLVGLLIALAGEGLIGFVQMIAPVWFVCAMVYKLKSLSAESGAAAASETLISDAVPVEG